MLEAAINLSNLVLEQNVVKWTQVDDVNQFIRKCEIAVHRLAALNQQLMGCHKSIEVKVSIIFCGL